jgi:hypothetical protein
VARNCRVTGMERKLRPFRDARFETFAAALSRFSVFRAAEPSRRENAQVSGCDGLVTTGDDGLEWRQPSVPKRP